MQEDDEEEDEDTETEEDDSGDANSDEGSYEESPSVRDFESKSKFTSYSMSSSVIKRNDGLRGLDDHFEKLFSEYDEDQIGALDTEEIDGYRQNNDLVLEQALSEFTELNRKRLYAPEARQAKLGVLVEKSEEESGDEENSQDENSDEDTLSEQSENENKKGGKISHAKIRLFILLKEY